MNEKDSPIVFLPGYGEDPQMCEPFRQALQAETGRDVIVGDYYDASVRGRIQSIDRVPSQRLADRVLQQLCERDVPLGDVVTHSYGAMVAERLHDSLSDDARMALIAPAGLGRIDIRLPVRFVTGMTKETVKHPTSLRFSLNGAVNVLRRPSDSAKEAYELTRANGLGHVRMLGARALVITYAEDPVFDDEKTTREFLRDPWGEVAVVSPLVSNANHSSFVEQPHETALLVARHFDDSLSVPRLG